jgi:hypothetical protein
MILKINGLALSLGEGEGLLRKKAAALLGLREEEIGEPRILRRSIDARRARPPRFVYLLTVALPEGLPWRSPGEEGEAAVTVAEEETEDRPPTPRAVLRVPRQRPVVAGCGPAGLFAALTLAEGGMPVLLLERGKPVPERIPDVDAFWERGLLNPESHVHFGEGGAGTFSDGKLTSRVKNPHTGRVKRVLVEMGAPASILTDARPHIGTDRLRAVVVSLRKRLVEMGCEVRFGARVTDFILHRGKLSGLVVNGREEVRTEHLILAIGQSADDTYGKLLERGIALAPKPFAVGFRIEHPQEAIDRIQYGRWSGHPELPPADYFLTARGAAMNRSVYTFCMCPGGQVIGCSSGAGGVVTNGMSRFRRDSPFANSAVVVQVGVEDLGSGDPLAGLAFRRRWEERAFRSGGGGYFAPAQRLIDFLADREGSAALTTSFLPGVREAPLREALPPFAVAALRQGLETFGRKMPGFVTREAILIGVETRSSSPVRILRGEDGQSVGTEGLFPCGEGAGYAGGIVSSALDGIRAAERLLQSLEN